MSQLICEWRGGDVGLCEEKARVVIDEAAGTVTFEHCHRSRRFLAIRTDQTYTCRFEEIRAVYLDWWAVVILRNFVHRRRDATISTPDGRAVINSRMAGFTEVVASLRSHLGPNRGPWLDNPNLWFGGILVVGLTLSIGGLIWALAG
jgi:hypothetical protein